MASFAFDIYAYNAPNGSRLVRLTPSKAVSLAFRLPEIGFGMNDGQIVIHSAHADATAANFHKHNLVKVVAIRDDLSETKIGGFFLEEGDFTALSTDEEGGRLLKFSGPNTLQYLERAILRERGYTTASIPAPTTRGGIDVDGMWTWGQDADGREPGPIMVRVLEEGRDQPGLPLQHATWDFTRSVDSAGTAWDALGDEWQVPWGTTALDMAILFIRSGEFYLRWTADLKYSAYKVDPGVNRANAIFVANKVRFAAGSNIVTEVHRGIDAAQDVSSVLVTGGEYETAFVTGGTSTVPWVRHVNAEEATVAARLTKIGQRELNARATRVDAAFPLTHIVQDDELDGGYIPFVHYAPGDMVTLHTGTGDHDFNNFTINVAAVRIVHDEAGNWFGMPELGAQTVEFGSRSIEERSNRLLERANPELCRPGTVGTPATVVHEWSFNGSRACDIHGTHLFHNGGTGEGLGDGFMFNNIIQTAPIANLASDIPPVVAGTIYTLDASIGNYTDRAGETVQLLAQFYTGPNPAAAEQVVATTTGTGLNPVGGTITAPAGADGLIVKAGRLSGSSNQLYLGPVTLSLDDAVAGTPRDGHPHSVGSSIRASRCDHSHDYHRDRPPTLNDDSSEGYKVRQTWAQLDDLVNPTRIIAVWQSASVTDGAAVWLPWPTGSTSSGEGVADYILDPRDNGAALDATGVNDANVASGSLSTVTSATAGFTSDDTGKTFTLASSSGAVTTGTLTFVNSTTCTMSVPAGGAITNGRLIYGTDDTTAWQTALDAALPGQMVDVLSSTFRSLCAGQLSVPTGVRLGQFGRGPFDPQTNPAMNTWGPTFVVVQHATTPFISLTNGCGLGDFIFYSANQVPPTATTATALAPFVHTIEGAAGWHIGSPYFANAYHGLKLYGGRGYVERPQIGALQIGVSIDQSQDVVDIDWITCHPFWRICEGQSYGPTAGSLDAHALNNAYALYIQRSDSFKVGSIFTFGLHGAVRPTDSSDTGLATRPGYGMIGMIDADQVAYAIRANSTNTPGIHVGQMIVAANALGVGTAGQAAIQTDTGGTMAPLIIVTEYESRGTWAVSEINEQAGEIRIIGSGATALDDLTDVTITSATLGDMLRYDGSVWVNSSGRWEVVMAPGITSPPDPVTTDDGTDWVYGWVS